MAENILGQDVEVTEPNQVWVADITYIWTMRGWLYLAAVIDLFSRKAVGWSMGAWMTQQLVLNALNQAMKRRNPPRGVLHHSDRGYQYASTAYGNRQDELGFVVSTSRKGNCYDNAFAESFFATLKGEPIYRYRAREETSHAMFEYVEVFYNRQRLHSSLGYMSPSDYEALATVAWDCVHVFRVSSGEPRSPLQVDLCSFHASFNVYNLSELNECSSTCLATGPLPRADVRMIMYNKHQ